MGEALNKLATGDFNNMNTVIGGTGETTITLTSRKYPETYVIKQDKDGNTTSEEKNE